MNTFFKLGNFRELCEVLNKSTELLVKNRQHLDNVLETLDLEHHTLIMMYVLCVKLTVPASPPAASPTQTQTADHHEILFSQVQEFIMGCTDAQIRYAPDTCKFIYMNIIISYYIHVYYLLAAQILLLI